MKIASAEFIKSAFDATHLVTDGLPEIAFLGRSNVGKSSLLNSLLLRKGLARTSRTPGRTQSINYFLVNSAFYFVDLPGYGYAKVPKAMRQEWGKLAGDYLETRKELALCVQLVDSRHKPSELDIELFDWLVENGRPHIIVATKSDKLSANKLNQSLKLIMETLGDPEIIAYSSETGKGRDKLWARISEALEK
ncbi:MAG: ribosome biogenesis GTP-binding protein YihA/YsxC [Acidobacteria bacterium]|nr:ribosome biogenesis GTP-binding protein YihA/YsxC [Acidobacteriota bacterium]